MATFKEDGKTLPESPFPAAFWFVLVSPLRRLLVNRRRWAADAGIVEGSTVLEVGCGPGFWTEYLARAVGARGKVIAQDVQPKMLERLRSRSRQFPVRSNIQPSLASSSALGLPDGSVDVVFASCVFEEIHRESETQPTAVELFRVLKPGGTLFFKEHRLGVRQAMIDEIFSTLRRVGFVPVSEKQTTFSYVASFRKR